MSDHPSLASQPPSDSLNTPSPPRKWARKAWIHITKHVGIGIVCSVAYFDPYVSLFSCLFSPQSLPGRLCFQGKLGRRFASWLRFWLQTSLRCPAGRNFCRYTPGDFLRFYFTLLGDPHPFFLMKGLTVKLGVVTGLGQRVSLDMFFHHPYQNPGSVRPCFPLSASLLQPVKAPQTLSMAHFISSLCLFRDSHHQYRFGRASWFGDRSQFTLP